MERDKGYNYRWERFDNRIEKNSKIFRIFSSKVHGDLATLAFKIYQVLELVLGDGTRFKRRKREK